MDEKPLDIEKHEGDGVASVWKRRIMLVVLIGICVSFVAASSGSGFGGLFGGDGGDVLGSYVVAGQRHQVDERRYARVSQSLHAAQGLVSPSRDQKFRDEDVWRHMILNDVARAEGVHVPDAQITAVLMQIGFAQSETKPDGTVVKTFDTARYREVLKHYAEQGTDHAALTERLREMIRWQTYAQVWLHAFDLTPSEELFDTWKVRNVKLTADYVALPFESFKERAESTPITDEEIGAVASLPAAVKLRGIPARRSFEIAILRVSEVTEANRAAMIEFLRSAGLFREDGELSSSAYRYYYGNRGSGQPFTRENWVAMRTPAYTAEKAAWDLEKAEWDKKEEPKEPMRAAPADPALVEWPTKDVEVFDRYWLTQVRDELLAREVLREMAGRAERESKSFGDLAADYEKFGVRVVTTPEPIADNEIATKFPEKLGSDSELSSVIQARFGGGVSGAPFLPKVTPDPVPTTRMNEKLADRGSFILRSTALVPAGLRDVAGVRTELEKMVVERRRSEYARAALSELKAKVEADAAAKGDGARAALRREAAAAGYEVLSLTRFNKSSWRPRATELLDTPESPATPARKAQAARIIHRNRVHDDYETLLAMSPGTFRDPILFDDGTGAAYLELLVEKSDPRPIELSDSTLDGERYFRTFQDQKKVQTLLSLDAVGPRYELKFSADYQKRWDDRVRDEKKDAGAGR